MEIITDGQAGTACSVDSLIVCRDRASKISIAGSIFWGVGIPAMFFALLFNNRQACVVFQLQNKLAANSIELILFATLQKHQSGGTNATNALH